ncbi:MAG TPA: biotin transporter BioY [bacterium]
MNSKTGRLVSIAIFAALTAAGGWIRIDTMAVPFTLQTLAVYLSGDLLDAKTAVLSQLLFLSIGLSGIPVFASGGGFGYVMHPTFGFLLGFPMAGGLISFLRKRASGPNRFLFLCTVNGLGMLLIQCFGVLYFYACMRLFLGKSVSFNQAVIAAGLVFVPVELVKLVCAAWISNRVRHVWPAALGIAFFFWVPSEKILAQNQPRLTRIRMEIQQLETALKAKEAKETTLLEQLESIDREIGLRQRLLAELEREQKRAGDAVDQAESRLDQAVESRRRQKEIVLQRIVAMYKRRHRMQWETLVLMRSLNQVLVWNKYQRRIMEADQRNLHLLQQKQIQVENEKKGLENHLDQKQRILRETAEEKKRYESDKTLRKTWLTQVRKEKKPILEQLRQKRLAFQKIKTWITEEENRRQAEEKRRQPAAPLPTAPPVGSKWNWPVRGSVVSKYGKQLDPGTRTWMENLGIDIETREKEKVQAVLAGQVKYVTWLRGMGNLVLVDHGGLYTVYGHLDDVFVNNADSVQQGGTLGQVGDRSSLYGSVLHFEVWRGTTHHDPMAWLR